MIAVVLGLGFALLLIAFRAPLLAAAGVATNLLATGAAFGIAKWIFQDDHLSGLLGFEPQGFLDAWGPVFFFAMIFAIAMDYTVFLLSSAREHWEESGDPRTAMVGAMAHSGRVILAAGRGDGRGVLHLRALWAAAAEGDGRDPRDRGPARRLPRPPAAAPGLSPAQWSSRLVSAGMAGPGLPRVHFGHADGQGAPAAFATPGDRTAVAGPPDSGVAVIESGARVGW